MIIIMVIIIIKLLSCTDHFTHAHIGLISMQAGSVFQECSQLDQEGSCNVE